MTGLPRPADAVRNYSLKQYNYIVWHPEELSRLVRQFNKQDVFALAGPEYARSKGETTPLLRPWYNRKSINLQHDVPLDDRIFSPELAQDVINGFRSLMPFYRYFDRLCASTAEA